MSYKTKYGKSEYEYDDDGSCVVITVNGKVWGSPQGDRFFRALLKDIQDFKAEIQRLELEVNDWQDEQQKWQRRFYESDESHKETMELLHSIKRGNKE
ncbi:hypothetical protein [Priestia megaterium]|uniref:hypothetical protein n=1 Tax=Priestia megaterium TaxID=1404 RepID=UPI003CC551D1